MDFSGNYILDAPRNRVWEALNQAEILQKTIPGCQHIEWTSDNTLEVIIAVNLGVAKPTFTGDLELSNVKPGESYTLSGKGRGGWLGKVGGAADITLTDTKTGTLLAFHANGGASGQIMAMGKTLVGVSAQKVIDGFFKRFGDAMGVAVTPIASDDLDDEAQVSSN